MNKIILGIAGEIASGKGTVAKYITEKYNGSIYRFSTILRDVLNRIYLEHSRENLQKLSTVLRQNFGEDTLSRVIAEDVKKDSSEIVAIDGVRRLTDISHLKNLQNFKLVYVEAAIENRHQRIIKRGENPDDISKSFEQFKKDHQQESELQIKNLKKHADFVIDNNGDLKNLHRQIDKIIKKCLSF